MKDDCTCPQWWEELWRIDPVNMPDPTEMAKLIIDSTKGITDGLVAKDDRGSLMAFLLLLRDFGVELERLKNEKESNNGTIDLNLN